eukprot:m.13501 g.13501  ORF g.13501 m.13501 type:complete len:1959 (+) comp3308_c0_seq1:33-5909(+)
MALPGDAPLREGYLVKLGYSSGKWQQRYFVLLPSLELVYSKMPGGPEKGRITLDRSCVIEHAAEGEIPTEDAMARGTRARAAVPAATLKVRTRCQKASAQFRTFYLQADSAVDAQRWQTALDSLLRPARDGGPATVAMTSIEQPAAPPAAAASHAAAPPPVEAAKEAPADAPADAPAEQPDKAASSESKAAPPVAKAPPAPQQATPPPQQPPAPSAATTATPATTAAPPPPKASTAPAPASPSVKSAGVKSDFGGLHPDLNTDSIVAGASGSMKLTDSLYTPEKPVVPKQRLRGELVTIRLFISSTFVDTHGERDILIKKVLPALNKDFAHRNVQVVPVDLRWGVSAAESTANQIQRTCLNEIDHCRTSHDEMPWFLGLRSARYGWVQTEFNPPSDFDEPERFEWMKDALKAHPHGLSITSMEVWHALLGAKAPTVQQPHAFFAFRETDFMEQVDDDWKWVFDFEYVSPDKELPESLELQYSKTDLVDTYRKDMETITRQIKEDPRAVSFSYNPRGKPITKQTGILPNRKRMGTGTVTGLEEFADNIYSLLYRAIDREYPDYATELSAQAMSDVQHELRARFLTDRFVGRKTELEQLRSYVTESCAEPRPLVVMGAPGCGKSALLAKLAKSFSDSHVDVVQHFVGADPSSFSTTEMLMRLALNLKQVLIGGVSRAVTQENARSSWFRNINLAGAGRSGDQRVLVIVDGASVLDGRAASGDWIPDSLPEHVRLIISVTGTKEEPSPLLEKLRQLKNKPREQTIQPLNKEDAMTLVRSFLDIYHKKLSEDASSHLGDQLSLLLSKRESSNPLYLLAALSELVSFGVYEKVTPYLESLPHSLIDLFAFVLELIEAEHGAEFVRLTMSLIVESSGGILENELNTILESYQYKDERISSFSRLYNSIRLYTTAGGAGIMRIFFAPLERVVRDRYLTTPEEIERINRILMSYYRCIADPSLDSTWAGNNVRGFTQLPEHVYRACGYNTFETLMSSPPFIHNKAVKAGVRSVLHDLDKRNSDLLCYIDNVITSAYNIISNEPDGLSLLLAARLSPVDLPIVQAFVAECRAYCPEYRPLDTLGFAPGKLGAMGADEGNADSETPPGLGELHSFTPKSPASTITPIVSGDKINIMAFSMGYVASILDAVEGVLDSESSIMGFYSYRSTTHPDQSVVLAINGGMMGSMGEPECRVFNARTGVLEKQIPIAGHSDALSDIAVSMENELYVASWDGTVSVHKFSDGSSLRTFSGHSGPVETLKIVDPSAKEPMILSADQSNNLILWNGKTCKEIARVSDAFECWDLVENPAMKSNNPCHISVSPDHSLVAVTGQRSMTSPTDGYPLNVYKTSNLSVVNKFRLEIGFPGTMTILSSGKQFAIDDMGTVVIYDMATGKPQIRLGADSNRVDSICRLPRNCIATSGCLGTVKVFGVDPNGQPEKEGESTKVSDPLDIESRCHGEDVEVLSFIDDHTVVSISNNKITFWDARTGKKMGSKSRKSDGPYVGGDDISGHVASHRVAGDTFVTFTHMKLSTWSTSDPFTGKLVAISEELPRSALDFVLISGTDNVALNSSDKLRVMNYKTGKVIASASSGKTQGRDVPFDKIFPMGKERFCTMLNRKITVYDSKLKQIAEHETTVAEHTYFSAAAIFCGADGKWRAFYEGLQGSKSIFIVHTLDTGETVTSPKPGSSYMQSSAVSPDKTRLLLTENIKYRVHVLSLPDLHPLLSIEAGFSPKQIAISERGDVALAGYKTGFVSFLQRSDRRDCTTPMWTSRPNDYEFDTTAKPDEEETIATKANVSDDAMKLREAAAKDDFETVRELLEAGADPNVADLEFGYTAICCAISAEMVKLLLEYGADATVVGGQATMCMGPLHICKTPEQAKLLLQAGADPNKLSSGGLSPLFQQLYGQHVDIAIALIEGGADVNTTYKLASQTPLDALTLMESMFEDKPAYNKLMKLLKEKGAKKFADL